MVTKTISSITASEVEIGIGVVGVTTPSKRNILFSKKHFKLIGSYLMNGGAKNEIMLTTIVIAV